MEWTIGEVTFDFSQNLAVVVFNRSGGIAMNATTISISFPVGANNQPPDTVAKKDMIARAKELLTQAAAVRLT